MNAKPVPEHFNFCPSCGSAEVSLLNDNCVVCTSCEFTLFFNPTSSAGALIFDDAGRLLVIERAKEPSKGKYGIPGGFADFGERLEEAVVRETKEEINLDLVSATFFASFPNLYPYRDIQYAVTDSYFLGSVSSFENLEAEKSEVTGIRFVDPRSVPEDQWAFDSLKSVISKYLGKR